MGVGALGVWIWARSRVSLAQRWVWIVGEKPPDLSFAALQFRGVLQFRHDDDGDPDDDDDDDPDDAAPGALQCNDKLKLGPIFRQFLLIIFVTFNDVYGNMMAEV